MKAEKTESKTPYKQMLVIAENGKKAYTTASIGEDDYIHISPIWKQLRMDVFKRDGFRCKRCGSAINLVVHHLTYPGVWGEEGLSDLVTLCCTCHNEVHMINNK